MQEERRKGIEIDNSSGLNLRESDTRPPSPRPSSEFVKVWKDEKHEKERRWEGGATSVLAQIEKEREFAKATPEQRKNVYGSQKTKR